MSGDSPRTVLLVEDEEFLLDLYHNWLADDYDVRTASGGAAALEAVDDSVDVVVLDRRMPDVSGDEALAGMRDRGYDGKVAMVTAVDPGVDIVDLPFDAYLTKPIHRADLLDVVERLGDVATRTAEEGDLFSVVQKRTALEEELPPSVLAESDEYRRLVERHEELSKRVEAAIGRLEAGPTDAPLLDGGEPAADPARDADD